MRTLMILNIFFNVLLLDIPAYAKEYGLNWSEVRFFITNTTFTHRDEDMDSVLQADQIEPLKKVSGFGLEADAEITSWFKAGTKIKGVFNAANKKEAPMPATEYLAIQQYSAGLTGRLMLINKDNLFLDLFGELGLSNNTIELKSSFGDAKWEKDSHFYQRAGASMGFGSSGFKMYVEGGYENFKIDKLNHQGTFGQNIDTIDLSGNYVAVGLVISGLPSWIKPGGVTIGGK